MGAISNRYSTSRLNDTDPSKIIETLRLRVVCDSFQSESVTGTGVHLANSHSFLPLDYLHLQKPEILSESGLHDAASTH